MTEIVIEVCQINPKAFKLPEKCSYSPAFTVFCVWRVGVTGLYENIQFFYVKAM
jgi:hypothetical protein